MKNRSPSHQGMSTAAPALARRFGPAEQGLRREDPQDIIRIIDEVLAVVDRPLAPGQVPRRHGPVDDVEVGPGRPRHRGGERLGRPGGQADEQGDLRLVAAEAGPEGIAPADQRVDPGHAGNRLGGQRPGPSAELLDDPRPKPICPAGRLGGDFLMPGPARRARGRPAGPPGPDSARRGRPARDRRRRRPPGCPARPRAPATIPQPATCSA